MKIAKIFRAVIHQLSGLAEKLVRYRGCGCSSRAGPSTVTAFFKHKYFIVNQIKKILCTGLKTKVPTLPFLPLFNGRIGGMLLYKKRFSYTPGGNIWPKSGKHVRNCYT